MLGYTLVKESELGQLQRDREVLESHRVAFGFATQVKEEAQHAALASACRAAAAERMVDLQTRSIAQLMDSNERLVKLVSDMRRVGFGILEPIETNDTPTTLDQADREAIKADPDLEADDDQ